MGSQSFTRNRLEMSKFPMGFYLMPAYDELFNDAPEVITRRLNVEYDKESDSCVMNSTWFDKAVKTVVIEKVAEHTLQDDVYLADVIAAWEAFLGKHDASMENLAACEPWTMFIGQVLIRIIQGDQTYGMTIPTDEGDSVSWLFCHKETRTWYKATYNFVESREEFRRFVQNPG